MKSSFLGRFLSLLQLLAFAALLVTATTSHASPAAAAATVPAPVHLAWDRVGSSLRSSA